MDWDFSSKQPDSEATTSVSLTEWAATFQLTKRAPYRRYRKQERKASIRVAVGWRPNVHDVAQVAHGPRSMRYYPGELWSSQIETPCPAIAVEKTSFTSQSHSWRILVNLSSSSSPRLDNWEILRCRTDSDAEWTKSWTLQRLIHLRGHICSFFFTKLRPFALSLLLHDTSCLFGEASTTIS